MCLGQRSEGVKIDELSLPLQYNLVGKTNMYTSAGKLNKGENIMLCKQEQGESKDYSFACFFLNITLISKHSNTYVYHNHPNS